MRNEVNRAHKAKTTLRYLLSLIAILSVVSVAAATFGTTYQPQRRGIQYTSSYSQMPTLSMSSTGSAMMQSGSALPMAAVSGTTTSNDNTLAGPQRAKRGIDGDDEGEKPGSWSNPYEDPIGDAVLPLMLMALAFCGVVYLRRKKRAVKVNG